jgi:Sua5/YciO/YrdC/YwlC family protein
MDDRIKKQIKKAKQKINDGEVVIYPTETAYGIGGDITDKKVIERVYESKQRPRSKGLTAIIDSLETAEKYSDLNSAEKRLVKEFMPGPLTLITERKNNVPESLNKDFAFRISSAEIASSLSQAAPIIATSANISGKETSYSVNEISDELKKKVDYIVDAGKLQRKPTSTIAEVSNSKIKVHREGPIKKQELEKHL